MSSFLMYARLLRPHHWVKNLLIFVPLIFSQTLPARDDLSRMILGFVIFSLMASAVYVLNDIADSKSDRNHPKKKHRPIALGTVSIRSAIFLVVFFGSSALVSAWFISRDFFWLLSIYFFITTLYSFWLKRLPIFDLLFVVSFYIIRLVAGGILAHVSISVFLFCITFFFALFTIALKRRQELVCGKDVPLYSHSFLDGVVVVAATGAIIFYILDAIDRPTLFLWSVLFFVYVIFRYAYLVVTLEKTEDPVVLAFRDPSVVAASFLWAFFALSFLFQL